MRTLILSFALLFSQKSTAGVGSDISFSSLIPYENAFHTYNFIFIGSDHFALGAVAQYSKPHYYLEDLIYGPGLRMGIAGYLVELSGGVFERKMTGVVQNGEEETRNGHGFAATILVGKKFGGRFRISMPAVFKRIDHQKEEDNLVNQWELEISPTFGIEIF